jgi:RNA polymerase sigma factor (sigma-70 family)
VRASGNQLANEVRQMARRKFLMMGIPSQDLDDLVQETVAAVIATADGYDESKGSVSSWVSGFTRNIARAWWRTHAHRRIVEAPLSSVESHADEEDRFDSPAALDDALRGLSPLDQELLQLRFAYGYSFEEIEQMTDLTSVAARKRVSRAIEQLRNHAALRDELGVAP